VKKYAVEITYRDFIVTERRRISIKSMRGKEAVVTEPKFGKRGYVKPVAKFGIERPRKSRE